MSLFKYTNVLKPAELNFYSRLSYRLMLLYCTVSKTVYNLKQMNNSVKLTHSDNTSYIQYRLIYYLRLDR